MKIDVQEIVSEKIKSMEESGVVHQLIEKTIESSILKAIEDSLGGYQIKRDIEKKISEQVNSVVNDIGFTAYNGFIAETIKKITEGTCRDDIAEKIQKAFKDILIIKHDGIKLSEICDKYKEYLEKELDDDEKRDLENFHVSIEIDPQYDWLTCSFSKKVPKISYLSSYEKCDIKFTIHRKYDDKNKGTMSTVCFEGYNIEKTLNLSRMSDFEALIANINYNKTVIAIDIESADDIKTYFNIDD